MAKRRPNSDGMVRKRADGRWEGRIVAGHKENGKPIFRSVFAKTQKELLPKLNQLKESYAGIELTEQSRITLEEWLDRWLQDYKSPMLRPSTLSTYRAGIENHIKPSRGSKPLTQITTDEIQKLYNKLMQSGRKDKAKGQALSNATVRKIHMLLHEALDSAKREGLIPNNPTEGTVPPKIVKKEKTVLLASQIQKFMELVGNDPFWHAFFYTDFMTGMRRGEICGLRWEDFDEESGKLKIERSVRYHHGEPIIGETKTDEGKRTFFLPESVWKLLSERKETAQTEWIFPNPSAPDRPLNPSTAYNRLKRLLKKAELPNMRFHDLRHTFATHAATSGIDPKTLAQIVGHTKASFTLDTYAHVTTDMQKNAASIVENYITDIFGEELKPWENEEENQATAP